VTFADMAFSGRALEPGPGEYDPREPSINAHTVHRPAIDFVCPPIIHLDHSVCIGAETCRLVPAELSVLSDDRENSERGMLQCHNG
jgi:hypothetical protein